MALSFIVIIFAFAVAVTLALVFFIIAQQNNEEGSHKEHPVYPEE